MLRALFILLICAGNSPCMAQLSARGDPDAIADLRPATGEKNIAEAWLIGETSRYPHFVLGSDHEAAGLRIRTGNGAVLSYILAPGLVFEDRQPRLADLDGDGLDEVVLVLTSLQHGASLAAFTVSNSEIVMLEKTPFIGRPFRWLNPAGIADFNGDGELDIALVAMPHLVKQLQFWTLKNDRFELLASADGFSNHRAGSANTSISAIADFNGDAIPDLLLPGSDRRSLSAVTIANGKVEIISTTLLPAALDANLRLTITGDGVVVRFDGASDSLPAIAIP